MCTLTADTYNRAAIEDALINTLVARNVLRLRSVAAAVLINEFPRLIDFSGEMVNFYF